MGGAYYIEFRAGGNRIRQNAGKDAEDADRQRQQKEAELTVRNAGVPILAQIDAERVTLTSANRRVPRRSETDQKTEDPGGLHDSSRLLSRILPQTLCH